MAKHNLTWQETDMHLLDALLLATGGDGSTNLQEVLLMADALDGTVFTLQELQDGLEKLVSVNFIAVQKNKLALTSHFMETYGSITHPEKDSEALMELLQQQELTEQKLETVRQHELKKYKLKSYYQQYLEQFG